MRMKMMAGALAVAAGLLCGPVTAHAGFITGELWVNQSGAANDATLAQAGSLGTPDATFNSGAFNYNSNVTGYTIADFLNHPTFTNKSANFVANGGGGATVDNTYFYFTGTIHLNAGVNSFVVAHDDGLQLNIDGAHKGTDDTGSSLVVKDAGPTSPTKTPFNVYVDNAGDYTFEMSYGECCGPPAELLWQVNGVTITSTPEPSSLALFGIGLAGLGVARRLRRRAA